MIPDYQTLFLPLLQFTRDGKEHTTREVYQHLAEKFQLSEAEQRELLPSGRQKVFYNRLCWAATYLKKAKLLQSKKRGHYQITERGLQLLKSNPAKIDTAMLRQFSTASTV